MICYLRCVPVCDDIRLQKYIYACDKRDVKYIAITWDRLRKNQKEDRDSFLKTDPMRP